MWRMKLFFLFLCTSSTLGCMKDVSGMQTIADYLQLKDPWCFTSEWETLARNSKVTFLRQANLVEAKTRIIRDDLGENLKEGNLIVRLHSEAAFADLMNSTGNLNSATLNPILLILPETVTSTEIMTSDNGKHISINHKVFLYNLVHEVVSEGYWINGVLVLRNLAYLKDGSPKTLQVSFRTYL